MDPASSSIRSTDTVRGFYGSAKTPCLVFTAVLRNGYTWYAVEGSRNVNLAPCMVTEGIWVERLTDVDYFYSSSPVCGERQLQQAIER